MHILLLAVLLFGRHFARVRSNVGIDLSGDDYQREGSPSYDVRRDRLSEIDRAWFQIGKKFSWSIV